MAVRCFLWVILTSVTLPCSQAFPPSTSLSKDVSLPKTLDGVGREQRVQNGRIPDQPALARGPLPQIPPSPHYARQYEPLPTSPQKHARRELARHSESEQRQFRVRTSFPCTLRVRFVPPIHFPFVFVLVDQRRPWRTLCADGG